MYYLYIKTHNETGLKYFGYTESKNPYTYKGSGKKWKRHIAKHGYNVTTEIVFSSEDREQTKQKALEYSALWNVVESEKWANLTTEQLEGGFYHINVSKEARAKSVESKRINGCFLPENNPMFGKKHSDSAKTKQSKMMKENNPNKNGCSEQHKLNQSLAAKRKPRFLCVHCNGSFMAHTLACWHGDKCKLNTNKRGQ
jgi:hypothetical protein